MPIDPSQVTVTIGGVGCTEAHAGYEEGIGVNGPESSKTYFCNWNDRYTVANTMLGLTTMHGGRGSPLSFAAPMQHPESANIYATDVRIIPLGRSYQGTKQSAWDVAKITCRFGVNQFGGFAAGDEINQSIDPDTKFVYASQEIDTTEETLEVPGSAMTLGGRQSNIRVAVPVAVAIMRITFYKMPFLAINSLPYYNHSNQNKFLGCAKGTVRFLGAQTRRTYQSDGSVAQDVTLTYKYRPIKDWNFAINPNLGGKVAGGSTIDTDIWAEIKFNDGQTYLYPYDDLSKTFPDTSYLDG